MTVDPFILSAAALSDDLRVWLRARAETPEQQASALVYELGALIAKHAPDEQAAYEVMYFWFATMKDQIRRLGVGVEHP